MRRVRAVGIALVLPVIAACAHQADRSGTLATLHNVRPDTSEVPVEQGLDRAVQSYRDFLQQAPDSALAPEAMRRLADLKIEKQFGLQGDGKPVELPNATPGATPVITAAATPAAAAEAPAVSAGPIASAALRAPARTKIDARSATASHPLPAGPGSAAVSEGDLERRATAPTAPAAAAPLALPAEMAADRGREGPLEAIQLYDELLEKYPQYAYRDHVLYQKARAYDELGQTDDAMKVMEQLVHEYPRSHFADEVQFRRAERFFIARKFREAERAYTAIADGGSGSEYYELALYKLGWTLYKQQLYEQALHRYFELLDFKVKSGYDFDAKHAEPEQRRIEDTFQVVSLSFSNIGGPDVIAGYFAANGHRAYEDRVYRQLAEYYLAKLRYQDAATVYKSFVALYPFHQSSPHFSMRVIEIYEKGGFPQLVLAGKKEFASTYGLQAEYWRHVDASKSPEVLRYLKGNLTDLANHYHAQYQDPKQHEQQAASYAEATHWYREFLAAFHDDPQAAAMDYQLADLMLENHDYAAAAREYEITAYEYPPHAKAAAAGYAAIYAHREYLKVAAGDVKDAARRDTINRTLRFADAFPQHEQAAVVLAAAAEDAYEMKDLVLARDSGQHLIDKFPDAAAGVRRDAWLVVAHSAFGLADYPAAEQAYGHVLDATPPGDASRAGLVENLAAAIYKQGELANQAGDYRAAANNFVRVKQVAPTSKICAAAEYDAGAALLRLNDWAAAAQVLDEFRRSFPEHELQKEATKQIAYAYQQAGKLAQSAGEYERVARESPNPQLRAEALLQAGDLYGQAGNADRALDAYTAYVAQFPKPVEAAIDTRVKMAQIWKTRGDQAEYHRLLEDIVRADVAAGSERTDRTRDVAARAALELTQPVYEQYASLRLTQPFDRSLQEKQRAMDAAIKAFGGLVDYQVGDVTAAATFYMAEIYANLSQALRESERPADLRGDALADYESQLAEAAEPLQQKAVAVHEKNLELMRRGLLDAWTRRSVDRLAVLKPDRYARSEISSGFIGSLERYVYRPPPIEPPAASATAIGAEAAHGTPTASPAIPEAAAPVATPATGDGAPAAAAPNGGAATAAAAGRHADGMIGPGTAGAGNAIGH